MFTDKKRFINSKLRDIVKLCRESRSGTLTLEESTILEQIKHNSKKSIEKLIDRQLRKADRKSYDKYNKRFDKLDAQLDKNKITQEMYDKKAEKAEYKYNKKQYELSNIDEKPKNQTLENIKNMFSKGLNATKQFFTTIGRGIGNFFGSKTPLMLKGVAREGFKIGYKTTKKLIKGPKALARGIKFVGNKVGEMTKDIREEANTEMRIKEAAKQQAKAIKNRNPRESLGMQHFEINHEQAIERVEDDVVNEKESKELEND